MDQEPDYAQVGWDINEPAIVVHRLAVDPAFRGAGIATELMRKAEEIAVERGIAVLRIDTNTHNQATQRLFPKLGYLLAGEITRPEYTVRFRWSPDALAMWDNQATAHAGPIDYVHFDLPRVVRRITVAGELPVGPDGFRSRALEGGLFGVIP